MRKMSWVRGCAVVVAMAASAAAQGKFSGTCSQGKPDPNYMAQVGDKADHAIGLAKVKCTWTKGEMGGVALKDEDDTVTSDIHGKTSKDLGYGVGTLADGDKYFVKFTGTTTYEKNAPVTGSCTWNFTGGTGKLKGLTGKGTCSGKFDATGAAVFNVEGEYAVAAAKAE